MLKPKEGIDFLPLTVDFIEKTFAAGKIPGGFFKREGRPSEKETLTCRLIDRPIRPLFPDGFYNEIHPKLRPVETVVDGVLIAGACQGPKTSAESVASGLAAVTQSAAVLKKGYTELDPLVAIIDPIACTACAGRSRRASRPCSTARRRAAWRRRAATWASMW